MISNTEIIWKYSHREVGHERAVGYPVFKHSVLNLISVIHHGSHDVRRSKSVEDMGPDMILRHLRVDVNVFLQN